MSPTLAGATAEQAGGAAPYQRHRPEHTLLYQIAEQYYPAFAALMAEQERPLPNYVQREFEDYLRCGCLEHGFLRVRCGFWMGSMLSGPMERSSGFAR
jgi:hypothetical protein